MSLEDRLARLARHYRDRGLGWTARRAWQVALRSVLNTEYIVFGAECGAVGRDPCGGVRGLEVACRWAATDILRDELQRIYAARIQGIADRHFEERFRLGACLWLGRLNGEPAGFVWTIKGRTIEPYFFPLGANDVHFFDNEVFSEHRGRGINPALIDHVLHALKDQGFCRAFIETRRWNQPELRSLSKTTFSRIAVARKYHVFGTVVSLWRPWDSPERRGGGRVAPFGPKTEG